MQTSNPGLMLITGARKGLGRAMAEAYLDKGWTVAGFSRRSSDLAHPAYHHSCVNVTDEAAVIAQLRSLQREHGAVKVLINNAGIASMNALLLTPTTTLNQLLQTNVSGTFLLMREVAKTMSRSGGGRIVNLSSIAAPLDLEGEAAYAASKAAVETLTRVAARELAQYGITVNAVGPTPVDTDLIRGIRKEKMDALLQRQPIKRMGTTDDVINVVDFFLSPRSDFITGQILYLGGVRG